MTLNNEQVEVLTDPPGDQARDTVMQQHIRLLLQYVDTLVSCTAFELKMDRNKASAVVLSTLSTTLMLYVRGYPKEYHGDMFSNVSTYFAQMAGQALAAQAKEGDGNDGASKAAN